VGGGIHRLLAGVGPLGSRGSSSLVYLVAQSIHLRGTIDPSGRDDFQPDLAKVSRVHRADQHVANHRSPGSVKSIRSHNDSDDRSPRPHMLELTPFGLCHVGILRLDPSPPAKLTSRRLRPVQWDARLALPLADTRHDGKEAEPESCGFVIIGPARRRGSRRPGEW
jgi:hypothetical protein